MATNTITSIYEGGMTFNTAIKNHNVIVDSDKASGGNDLGTSRRY